MFLVLEFADEKSLFAFSSQLLEKGESGLSIGLVLKMDITPRGPHFFPLDLGADKWAEGLEENSEHFFSENWRKFVDKERP